jgi:hypothetical protein
LISYMASESRGSRRGKQITLQASIGQQGVNLIERIVLEMGSAWHPANASLDAGIDGEIELVDPSTRYASNSVIRVQSKATERSFPKETADGFEWLVSERDLDYWLSGNAPVALIVSRPSASEAYWVSVKDYFASPARRKSLRVHFDKHGMRFAPDALHALFNLAIPRGTGIYLAPRPRAEDLFSNLLRVSSFPPLLWIGTTDLRRRGDVFGKLRSAGVTAPEFVLRDGRLLAPYDLTEAPWVNFVDRGTVEEIETSHWASSGDRDLTNRFVELMNLCLSVRCHQIDCELRGGSVPMYYFAPTRDLGPRIIPYRSIKETTKRTVFSAYQYKKGDRLGEVAYYRHSAFLGEFRRFDADWYLEITPTYLFTSDGRKRHPFYESKLKGIKAVEKNGTVLGQVVMWSALLRGRDEDHAGFFTAPPYPHLGFGQLATFQLPVGIDDTSWLPNEEKLAAASVAQTADDLPLFRDMNPYADEDDVDTSAGDDDAA